MDQLWFYLEALRHVLWNKKLLGHGLEELTTFTPVALNIIPSYDDTRGAWVLRLCLNRVLAHHRWVTKETLTNVRYMAAICSQLHTHARFFSRFTTEHNMVAYPEKNSNMIMLILIKISPFKAIHSALPIFIMFSLKVFKTWMH